MQSTKSAENSFWTARRALDLIGPAMDEVVQRVLTEFRDPKFLDEVETFVNCHIEEFAVVHPDGSCPMQWMNIHRKYRKIYEDKLLQVLDDCDAECACAWKCFVFWTKAHVLLSFGEQIAVLCICLGCLVVWFCSVVVVGYKWP